MVAAYLLLKSHRLARASLPRAPVGVLCPMVHALVLAAVAIYAVVGALTA